MDSTKKPYSFFKKTLIFVFFSIVVVGVSLPYLIPKSFIESNIARIIEGKILIENISLSLFGPQKIKGLSIENNKADGFIESLTVRNSFYAMVLFPSSTTIEIDDFTAKVTANIFTNEADSKKEATAKFSTPDLYFKNGKVEVFDSIFSQIEGHFLADTHFIESSIKLHRSIDGVEGKLDSACRIDQKFFEEKDLESLKDSSLYLIFENFPLQNLGSVAEYLGDTVHGKVALSSNPSFQIDASISSPFLQLESFVRADEDTLIFEKPTKISYLITQSLFNAYKLNGTIFKPGSIQCTIFSLNDWNVQLSNTISLGIDQENLAIKSFSGSSKGGVFNAQMLLNQKKLNSEVILSGNSLENFNFSIKNLSSIWFAIHPKLSFLQEFGPQINAQLSKSSSSADLYLNTTNLQIPALNFIKEGENWSLDKPAQINSKWGAFSWNSFLQKDENFALDITGTPRFFIVYKDYSANLVFPQFNIKKTLYDPLLMDLKGDYSDLKSPYPEIFGTIGSIEGKFSYENNQIKGADISLKSQFLDLSTAFSFSMKTMQTLSNTTSFIDYHNPQYAPISCKLEEYKFLNIENFYCKGSISCKEGQLPYNPIKIEHGKSVFSVTALPNGFDINLDGKADLLDSNNSIVSVDADVKVTKKDNKFTSKGLHIKGKNLPISSMDGPIKNAIQGPVDIEIIANGDPVIEGQITLNADNLKAKLFGSVNQDGITLNSKQKNSYVDYSPLQNIELEFLKQVEVSITKSGKISVDVSSLFIPYKMDRNLIELVATLDIEDFTLENGSNKNQTTIQKIHADLNKKKLGPVIFNLDWATKNINFKSQTSVFGNGSFKFLTDPNKIKTANVLAKFSNFPLLNIGALGDNLSGVIHFDTDRGSGKASLQLGSENLDLNVFGNILEGVFLPSDTMSLKVKSLTLEDFYLEKSSSVEVRVPPKNVSIPVFDFELQKVTVPKILVSPFMTINKVSGNLQNIAQGLNLSYKGYVPTYVVPSCSESKKMADDRKIATFSIFDSNLFLSRTDTLINNKLWLLFWGSCNLKTLDTTLFLGIPGPTLNTTLGITNLNKNFVLPIRIKGKIDDLKITKQDVIAAIAYLTTKLYAQKIAPNPAQNLIEVLIDQSGIPPMSCPPSWVDWL
jgi:hypothetical protein